MAFTKVLPAGINTSQNYNFSSLTVTGNVSIAGTITYEDVTNVDAVGLVTARSGIHVIGTGSSIGIGTAVPEYPLHVKAVGTGGTSLYIVGQSQLNRVALTTTSSNITLEAGRTYVYYATGTYTLPASPTVGDRIEIINRSGTTTAVLGRNGSNIMGVADDVLLDILDETFKVTYSNSTDGWVIGS